MSKHITRTVLEFKLKDFLEAYPVKFSVNPVDKKQQALVGI